MSTENEVGLTSGNIGALLPDELTVQLRSPVTFADQTYTELHLTEPTVAQLKAAQKPSSGIEQIAVLIQQTAKVPTAVIEKLSQRDFQECASFFVAFSDPNH